MLPSEYFVHDAVGLIHSRGNPSGLLVAILIVLWLRHEDLIEDLLGSRRALLFLVIGALVLLNIYGIILLGVLVSLLLLLFVPDDLKILKD